MKKSILSVLLLPVAVAGSAQKITGKLKFEQGKTYAISMDMKTSFTQQAMGQAIDFNVNGMAIHNYKVTNATDDNNTLHHDMSRISFQFDGMGQKMNFDSDNPKDLEGKLGKPIKDILDKTYDVIIDPNGKVLMAQPEKVTISAMDDRMRIVTDMLKELTGVVQPPKKGEGSFFRILPENEAAVGDSWTETGTNDNGQFSNTYTLTELNDSTAVVNLSGNSTSTAKADMMGMETITTMNHKTTGTIIVDKATGIVRQKQFTTESNGSTQVMGNSLPLSSKTTTVITVK